jgi:hypothetical protein
MSQNHRRITSRNTFFINIIIFINNPTVGTVLTERYTGLLGEPQFGVHRSQACQEGCKDLESEQCADPASLGKPLDHIVQDQLSLTAQRPRAATPDEAAAPAASSTTVAAPHSPVALFVVTASTAVAALALPRGHPCLVVVPQAPSSPARGYPCPQLSFLPVPLTV